MIKINDERQLLNLDHTVIYLMLTPKEHQAYGNKLRTLTNNATLTKGLFHFDIVEKGGSPYEQLPSEMLRATRECNVFVRLINSIHGIYCYGLECVDIEADIEELTAQLIAFVEATCREDIMNLEILTPRSSTISVQAMNYYKAHQLFSEVFECALTLNTDDIEEARQAIADATLSNDADTSHELMQGAIDNNHSDEIEKKRCEKEAPMVRPDITVEIKNVPTGEVTKSLGAKLGLGIEITINGETPIPVYFGHYRVGNSSLGGTHLTFLYLALLVAKKEGIHLRRTDFTDNANSYTLDWLRKKLKKFRLYKTFEELYGAKNEDEVAVLAKESRKLNQAKANINTILWKLLSDQYKDAYHYLCVHLCDKRKPSSRYDIELDSEQIIVPDSYLD